METPNTTTLPAVPKKRRFLRVLSCAACVLLVLAAVLWYHWSRPGKTTQFQKTAPVEAKEIDPFEAAATVSDSPVFADCWPSWRGYDGRGIAPLATPPVEFGPDKAVLWKTPVAGKGYSSPILWKDRLFLTTEIDKELFLLCYDTADGEQVWRTPVGKAQGSTHRENGYASATPVTDGKHVFSFFGATGLFCHDFDGKEIWKTDLGNLRQMHGLGASPILYGNLVIQLCDNASGSFIGAYDKTTGKEVWRTDRKCGGWTTPVVVSTTAIDGKTRDEMLVNGGCPGFLSQGVFTAYDPATGKEWWNWPGPVAWGIPTALFSEDKAFVLAGQNGPLAAIRLGGSGDVTTTHLLWSRTRSSPYVPSGVFYRNRLYVPSDRARIDCFNPGTGEPIYEKKVDDTFYASLLAAAGRIYAFGRSGKVYVLEVGDARKILAETDFNETCFASPAAVNNRLYLRTETTLYCFSEEP